MVRHNHSELITSSLHMRANYIETGNVALSAKDAAESNQHKLIKSLDEDQQDLVDQLRKLARAYEVIHEVEIQGSFKKEGES